MSIQLEGVSREVQGHVAGIVHEAGTLIAEHGKAHGMSVDSAGRICALEALARSAGYGNDALPFGKVVFSEEVFSRVNDDLAVIAFAQWLLLTGRALLIHEDQSYSSVIWQYSDDHDIEDVVESFYLAAQSLEV